MEATTTGSWGVAIGWSALEAQTDANYNVAIGFAAGKIPKIPLKMKTIK